MTTSDKLLTLDNIRRQFNQDCIVVYKNFVFQANPITILALGDGMPTDKDGFPVPLITSDCGDLILLLARVYETARAKYFERMGALGIDKLTEVKSSEDEELE